jgi:putative phosphoribosyl transferase
MNGFGFLKPLFNTGGSALFHDRDEAGRLLARRLEHYTGTPDLLVLGLPRGGVPVAFAIASALQAPLDVFIVRKIGVPNQPELAMGAIASGGIRILNQAVIAELQITPQEIEQVTQAELRELERRTRLYHTRPPARIAGQTVIIVDDGMATGATMRTAVEALRRQNPRHLVVAVPVAARESLPLIEPFVDAIICEHIPQHFEALSLWYEDFRQTSDGEVRMLLERNSAG